MKSLNYHHCLRQYHIIYKWHASFITQANPFPVILVDWSDVREQLHHMTLRASVAVKGQAVTVYEQAFEYKNYNSPKSHQLFWDQLCNGALVHGVVE